MLIGAGSGQIAIIAVSRRGAELARRLALDLPDSRAVVPARFARPGDIAHDGAAAAVTAAFAETSGLVLVMAAGIAVRLIAPHLADKRRDPAVVVVDDGGRFAISLLSGHLGGANALAARVSALLRATPVVTTASEAAGLPALDLLAATQGWRPDPRGDLTGVSAALVNGEAVGLLQECGRCDWLPQPPPTNLLCHRSVADLVAARPEAAIVISDREPVSLPEGLPGVLFRPPTLVLGVGASRGAPVAELCALAEEALAEGRLSALSIAAVASIDAKREEPAIAALAQRFEASLRTFTAAELDRVPGDWQRSDIVARAVGVGGVCEPAALLASGGDLVVRKRKSAHGTVALARRAEGVP